MSLKDRDIVDFQAATALNRDAGVSMLGAISGGGTCLTIDGTRHCDVPHSVSPLKITLLLTLGLVVLYMCMTVFMDLANSTTLLPLLACETGRGFSDPVAGCVSAQSINSEAFLSEGCSAVIDLPFEFSKSGSGNLMSSFDSTSSSGLSGLEEGKGCGDTIQQSAQCGGLWGNIASLETCCVTLETSVGASFQQSIAIPDSFSFGASSGCLEDMVEVPLTLFTTLGEGVAGIITDVPEIVDTILFQAIGPAVLDALLDMGDIALDIALELIMRALRFLARLVEEAARELARLANIANGYLMGFLVDVGGFIVDVVNVVAGVVTDIVDALLDFFLGGGTTEPIGVEMWGYSYPEYVNHAVVYEQYPILSERSWRIHVWNSLIFARIYRVNSLFTGDESAYYDQILGNYGTFWFDYYSSIDSAAFFAYDAPSDTYAFESNIFHNTWNPGEYKERRDLIAAGLQMLWHYRWVVNDGLDHRAEFFEDYFFQDNDDEVFGVQNPPVATVSSPSVVDFVTPSSLPTYSIQAAFNKPVDAGAAVLTDVFSSIPTTTLTNFVIVDPQTITFDLTPHTDFDSSYLVKVTADELFHADFPTLGVTESTQSVFNYVHPPHGSLHIVGNPLVDDPIGFLLLFDRDVTDLTIGDLTIDNGAVVLNNLISVSAKQYTFDAQLMGETGVMNLSLLPSSVQASVAPFPLNVSGTSVMFTV